MRTAVLITICLSATAAIAQPTNARVGQLAELRFERDSAELPAIAREQTQRSLGSVAAWALENPEGVVVINGHADRTGRSAYNAKLSLRRAEHVRDELVNDYGVDPDQIVVSAFGGQNARQQVVIWGTRTNAARVAARRPTNPAVPTRVTFR